MIMVNHTIVNFNQVAQLSQSDSAAGWASFSQKSKTGTGRQYFTQSVQNLNNELR